MKRRKIIAYNLWKIYVGIIFLFVFAFIYPMLFVTLQFKSLKVVSFKLLALLCRLMRIFCFYAVESNPIPDKGESPSIFISNHTSYLDILLLYTCFTKHHFLILGKSELLQYPFVKTIFKKLNIAVDRSSKIRAGRSFLKSLKTLEEGWNIAIFPEGSIFEDAPNLHPFKEGAFQLAKQKGCSILPITFRNNYKLLSDPENISAPAMPGLAQVYFHPLIAAEDIKREEVNTINKNAFKIINSKLDL